jgi:hypothetical protein
MEDGLRTLLEEISRSGWKGRALEKEDWGLGMVLGKVKEFEPVYLYHCQRGSLG